MIHITAINNADAVPVIIDLYIHHVLAYDLEHEYLGQATSCVQTPLLCTSLYRNSGYNVTASRELQGPKLNHIVVHSNNDRSETVI